MLSKEVGAAMGAAYSWESMCAQLTCWHKTFQYRWIGKHIVHPLSIEETAARQRILDAGFKFVAAIYRRDRADGR